MKTKWGSCNRQTGHIWFNVELAKKHPESLEYLVVHEMAHLLEREICRVDPLAGADLFVSDDGDVVVPGDSAERAGAGNVHAGEGERDQRDQDARDVVFVHTGGLFGVFPQKGSFKFA